MGRGDRPEHTAPPEVFYNDNEARKYTTNSRMVSIQATLTERALELLALPDDGLPRLLLDLGCGSGLSGEELTNRGHTWVGADISPAMLGVALEREVEGDLLLGDLGHGLPLRAGTFDGAISISAVQWLCNARGAQDSRGADPRRRLQRFFQTLYACLTRGARAVLQVYPEGARQATLLTDAAMRAGFSGGLVVDFPHSTRAKKYFLVLMVGSAGALPAAVGTDGEAPGDEADEVAVAARRQPKKKRRGIVGALAGSARHPEAKGKGWVLKKKEQARQRGYSNIPTDTKYTGRKRKSRF